MKQYHIRYVDSPSGTHLAVLLGLIHNKRSVTGQFNIKYYDKHVAKFVYEDACRDSVICDFKDLIERLGL